MIDYKIKKYIYLYDKFDQLWNQGFSVQHIYNEFITKKVLDFGKQTTSILDIGSVELIGPA